MNAGPEVPVASPRGPRPARRGRVLWLLVLALAVAGCGLRLDTAPPEPAAPDAVEVARQEAAQAADRLERAATAAAADEAREDVATALTTVAEASAAHREALGGVWVAWPDGVPEGVETPPPPPAGAGASATAAEVLELLTQSAADAREQALAAPDADLAAVLASVAVWRTWVTADLAGTLEAEVELPTGQPYPVESVTGSQMDSRTILVLDSGRYALEVAAARTEGEPRERAAERARHLAALTDAAVAVGSQDPRRSAYGLGDGDPAPPDVAAAAESRLLEQWVFRISVAPRAARADLLEAAVYTAGEVRAWGASLTDLPGIG